MYVESSITVCLSELVKVDFRNFTFKEPEDEKDCLKEEKPGSSAEKGCRTKSSLLQTPELAGNRTINSS